MTVTREAVAKVIVINQAGKFLALRTSEWRDNPLKSLQPDLPGGMVEAGELPSLAATREVKEETGIALDEKTLALLYTETKYWEKTNNSVCKFVYVARTNSDDVTLSWEHDQYQWLCLDDFAAVVWRPFYKEAIDHAIRYKLFDEFL